MAKYERKGKRLFYQVSFDDFEKLEKYAKTMGVSYSTFTRMAVKHFLDYLDNNNPFNISEIVPKKVIKLVKRA